MKTQIIPPYLRGFHKHFEKACYSKNYAEVFGDFLDVVMCCFAYGTQEEKYFEVLNRYEKREFNEFPKMLGELTLIYNKEIKGGWCDPLGDFYEILSGGYKQQALGQFFTPKAVCDVMAGLQIREEDKDKKGLKINDPACGSGRLLLAMNAISKDQLYFAEDLDPMCCKMTCINMMYHGLKGHVWQHDTLCNPTTYINAWAINDSKHYPSIRKLPPQRPKAEIKTIKQMEKPRQITLQF